MSLHQIIHTSRKCGLYGGQPGFGILSRDRDYPSADDFGSLLYDYKAPDLDIGPEYSQKIISYMPVSYTYRYIDGTCAVTRSAFLGRDPFGPGQNHISHSILFSETESYIYPCEYIGSPSFITEPNGAAVNAEAGVGYVDTPVLAAGTAVTVNKVMKFLSYPGNYEIFKNMLWALLHKDETKRRLIICDEQENIKMWISALNYVLPLPFAKKLSFSTYSYDPMNAGVDICGATSKCTAYDYQTCEENGFCVFDITAGSCFDPGMYTDEEDFYDFIELAMLHDYGKIKQFHAYIEQYCDLDKVSSALCPAYLMSRASGCYAGENKDSFKSVSADEFDKIAEFSGRHSRYGGKLLLFESMLNVSETVLGLGAAQIVKILGYMSAIYKDASVILQNGFHSLAVDSVPITMIARESTSSSFGKFFEEVSDMTQFCGIDLTNELMSAQSRGALLFVAQYQHIEWKPDFIITLISDYVHKNNLGYEALSSGATIGEFMSKIIKERYACGNDKEASKHALMLYTDDVKRFCTVEETLEEVTDGISDGLSVNVNLTSAFSELAAAHLQEKRSELFDFLAANEKYDLMWSTLRQMISTYDVKFTTTVISEHYTEYFSASADYSKTYLSDAVEEYYAVYKKKRPEGIKEAEELIFNIISSDKIVVPSSGAVVDGMISRLKFSSPDKEAENTINALCEYECGVRGNELSGKLLCAAFGVAVKGIKNRKDYHASKPYLSKLTEKEQIDLTHFTDSETKTYLDWVLPLFSENAEAEEIPYIYDLFVFTTPQSTEFAECFCGEWLNEGKRESDYTEFCKFLRFLYTRLGADELQAVAEKVHKLNSKRMEQLKADADAAFAEDFAMTEKFNAMLAIQPKKRSLFSFFKK